MLTAIEVLDREFDIEPTENTVKQAAALALAALQTSIHETFLAGSPVPSDRDRFGLEFQAALEMYLDGNLDTFETYLSDRGMTIPPLCCEEDEKPEHRDLHWPLYAKLLRYSKLSTSGLAIRARYLGGQEQLADAEEDNFSITRVERYPTVADPLGLGLDTYEILVPAVMNPLEAPEFQGILGLWFVQDPERITWVLWKISIYGVPTEVSIVLPML